MKKICTFILVASLILLISSLAMAIDPEAGSVPRGATATYDGETVVTNIAATGKDVPGVPGYLKLYGLSSDETTVIPYYVWVDSTGDLRIASESTMTTYASFPDVNSWSTSMGSVVGGQS